MPVLHTHSFAFSETLFHFWQNCFIGFMQAIGLAIRESRERAELTQEELAELSHVAVRTVRKLESGQGNIGIKALGQIAQVLGLTLNLSPTK